jgi:hypothetical protein
MKFISGFCVFARFCELFHKTSTAHGAGFATGALTRSQKHP